MGQPACWYSWCTAGVGGAAGTGLRLQQRPAGTACASTVVPFMHCCSAWLPLLQMRHVVIPSWYQRPGYVRAMADLIEEQVAGPGAEGAGGGGWVGWLGGRECWVELASAGGEGRQAQPQRRKPLGSPCNKASWPHLHCKS